MRSATGPQWLVRHEVSYEAQFVLWLRRRLGSACGLAQPQWMEWMDRAVRARGTSSPDVIAATAPDEELRAVCVPLWSQFVHEWEPEQRVILEQRIGALATDRGVGVRIRKIMGNSDDQLILVQTDEPGTMCRQVGETVWLLGEAHLEPHALCALLDRLRRQRLEASGRP